MPMPGVAASGVDRVSVGASGAGVASFVTTVRSRSPSSSLSGFGGMSVGSSRAGASSTACSAPGAGAASSVGATSGAGTTSVATTVRSNSPSSSSSSDVVSGGHGISGIAGRRVTSTTAVGSGCAVVMRGEAPDTDSALRRRTLHSAVGFNVLVLVVLVANWCCFQPVSAC
uniref:Uncharacterized protein n=1 Tax=Anopheles farauti TaxID=69004 RepID=A0A182Q7Y5_9DIPT